MLGLRKGGAGDDLPAHHGVDLAALAKDPAHRDFVRDQLNPARAARREAAGEQTGGVDAARPPERRGQGGRDRGGARRARPPRPLS
jgi:hypothetical protein